MAASHVNIIRRSVVKARHISQEIQEGVYTSATRTQSALQSRQIPGIATCLEAGVKLSCRGTDAITTGPLLFIFTIGVFFRIFGT